jgi:hypothetical protein
MRQNIGNTDRIVRLAMGIGFFAFFLLVTAPIRWFGILGFIPLLTAYAGSCPMYNVLGIDTRRPAARRR